MQDETKTYAYLLLSAAEPVLEFESNDANAEEFYSGGVLELYISSDVQADSVTELNPIEEWEDEVTRIAPVQFTRDWNPGNFLQTVLADCHCEMLYQNSDDALNLDGEFNLVFFSNMPNRDDLKRAISANLRQLPDVSSDIQRFCDVLVETVNLARREQRYLLFIGNWGWDYFASDEWIQERGDLLKAAGFKFLDRHGNCLNPHLSTSEILSDQDQCISNLRQMATAIVMYASDNDETLPDASWWRAQIAVYLKEDENVFSCPASNSHDSYAMNTNLSKAAYDQIKYPKETVLLYESDEKGKVLTNPRHPEGHVVAFADGHVEVIAHQTFAQLNWQLDACE